VEHPLRGLTLNNEDERPRAQSRSDLIARFGARAGCYNLLR